MPATLTAPEIANVVAYLKTLNGEHESRAPG